MIFFSAHNELVNFEEEEETIDDSLLGELDEELDEDIDEELDPLLKESAFDVLTEETDAVDPLDETGSKFFDEDDEDEEEDMDYDSFDDEDEL